VYRVTTAVAVQLSFWCDTLTFGFTTLEKEAIQCTATKFINPEVQINRKSCVGLSVSTSIEKSPSIEPSDVNT